MADSEKFDALVMTVMRGTHREARDMARARFVEMCPEERGHAEKVAREADALVSMHDRLEASVARCASLEALVRELADGVRRMTYTDAAGRLLIGLVEDSDVSSYVGAALASPIVSELTGEKEGGE